MSASLLQSSSLLVLANRRAEHDVTLLQAAFPDVRFVAAGPDRWREAVASAHGVFLGYAVPVDELLERAPALRWIHTESAGVDRTLTPRLRSSPVVLTNSAGAHAVPIAEHVLALMFAFARRLPDLARAQARHEWRRRKPGEPFAFELQGQTLAVIGLGGIGQILAQKASALGLRVLGVRRNASAEHVPGVEKTFLIEQIDDALAEADHVAICLPLTPQTRDLFDDARFSRLRPGTHLYNIGRGPIINQDALLRALAGGRLAGAGLDVTTPEPLPADSPLWDHPQIVITHHSAGGSPKTGERTLALFRENVSHALSGRALRNIIDKTHGY